MITCVPFMLYRKITSGQQHDIWKHMNILDLPEDVHDHIGFVLGGDRRICVLRNRLVVKGASWQQAVLEVACRRIQLWYRIHREYRYLELFIRTNLERTFARIDRSPPSARALRVPSRCVYYAPVVPDGPCRVCTQRSAQHPFSERLVSKFL